MQILRIGVTEFRKANSIDFPDEFLSILQYWTSTSQSNLFVSSSSIYQKYYIYPLEMFNSASTTITYCIPQTRWKCYGSKKLQLISTVSQQVVNKEQTSGT